MKKIAIGLLLMASVAFGGDFEDGLKAYDASKYKQALTLWQKAAKQGNASAQYNLGWMYNNGTGVKKNYKKAVALYQEAAEQGNARAQVNLGTMYYNGTGVKKNKIKAYQWWRKAAKQGDDTAAGNLDILCSNSAWACK